MSEEIIRSIGKKLRRNEGRDAIHIAIMPVVAAENLRRGDPVRFVYGTSNQVKGCEPCYALQPVGVIDPFLRGEYGMGEVKKGETVWLFLQPGTITGLRHEWAHPEIDGQRAPKNESERWLREFADKWNFDYDEMIRGAQEDEGYVVAQGIDLHSRSELDSGDEELFWQHIGVLTGRTYDADHREKFGWSCTC